MATQKTKYEAILEITALYKQFTKDRSLQELDHFIDDVRKEIKKEEEQNNQLWVDKIRDYFDLGYYADYYHDNISKGKYLNYGEHEEIARLLWKYNKDMREDFLDAIYDYKDDLINGFIDQTNNYGKYVAEAFNKHASIWIQEEFNRLCEENGHPEIDESVDVKSIHETHGPL